MNHTVRPVAGTVVAKVVTAFTVLALTTLAVVAVPTGPAAAEDVPGRLLLVLDASGSMAEPDPSGLTKMAAAQRALTSVVSSLPGDSTVGLRVYGATEAGGTPTPAACADTQLSVPIGRIDKPALTAAIDGYRAKGETPIAYSLTQALTDLGAEGKRNIVLVSDGQESCVPDPCPTVRQLVGSGVDLQIDTVGFGVDARARAQLQCIAAAGRGTYYDAKDATALSSSLAKLSMRALRPNLVDGTPVTAAAAATTAPTITPGRWVDRFTPGTPTRFLRVERTPGSTVHVTAASYPVQRGLSSDETWNVSLKAPDGTLCDSAVGSGGDFSTGVNVITAGVTAGPQPAEPGAVPSAAADPCADSPTLVLDLEYVRGSGDEAALQLAYVEEPAVQDTADLPPALDPAAPAVPEAVPAAADPRTIAGGGGFADALELAPGSYVDSLLPGEVGFYRVRLDFGQAARVTAEVGTIDPVPAWSSVADSFFSVDVWTPSLTSFSAFGIAGSANAGYVSGDTPSTSLTGFVPQVRYLNRANDNDSLLGNAWKEVSLPGYYYVAVSRDGRSSAAADVPVPVGINVAIDGSATGAPAYTGQGAPSTGSPSGTPTAGRDQAVTPAGPQGTDGMGPWPWAAGGVAVAALAAAGWILVRRRRSQGGGASHA